MITIPIFTIPDEFFSNLLLSLIMFALGYYLARDRYKYKECPTCKGAGAVERKAGEK